MAAVAATTPRGWFPDPDPDPDPEPDPNDNADADAGTGVDAAGDCAPERSLVPRSAAVSDGLAKNIAGVTAGAGAGAGVEAGAEAGTRAGLLGPGCAYDTTAHQHTHRSSCETKKLFKAKTSA